MNIQNNLDRFKDCLKKQRYSPNSIKNYHSNVLLFLTLASHKFATVEEITIESIEEYLHLKIKKDHLSASHQRVILASITQFYALVLGRNINLKCLYPKRIEHKPLNYLTIAEVKNLIEITTNVKHKSIIALLYSSGLCLSEVINLKIADIDPKAMTITIRKPKGKKDRQVMLSENFLLIIKQYYLKYKPCLYLFEGLNHNHYSSRSIQQLVQKNALKAGLDKTVTPHILRHSFAMHLIESGTDIRYVQKILGHRDLKTTERYTNIEKATLIHIKSPFD